MTMKLEFIARREYVEYLDNHPNLVIRQNCLDRQLVCGQMSAYYAYFYILRFNQMYIGVLESARPHSATYLYEFPDANYHLHSLFYRNDLAEPYILREPDNRYIEQIEKINQLLKEKNELESEGFEETEGRMEEIKEELEELTSKVISPIKYRDYFIDEVVHLTLNEWIVKLEKTIIKYFAGGYKRRQNKYRIQSDNIYDVLVYSLKTGDNFDYFFKIKEIELEIEKNYRKKQDYVGDDKRAKRIENGQVVKEISQRLEQMKIRIPKQNLNKQVGYDLKELRDKSVKEIAYLLYISPDKLLQMIQERISSVYVKNINDRLDINQVSLCKRIFDELWYINKKHNQI